MEAALQFRNPPVNEVGITVAFGDKGVISDYEIGKIHDLYRDELPEIERAAPSPGSEILQMLGRPPLSLDGQMSRWWLKSRDDRFVLQLQENFLGFNWRRRASKGGQTEYPGYDHLKSEFDRHLNTLVRWHEGRGSSLPSPTAVELLYDDIIEIQVSDERPKLADFLSFWNYERDTPMFGWNASWLEAISDNQTPNPPMMKFGAMQALIPDGKSFSPVIRLTFTAMALVQSFADIDVFLHNAHLHIRRRFLEVVTETARSAWGDEK